MAFLANKTLFKILEKNFLLKSLKTPLTRFNFLHKINIRVPVTSSSQALATVCWNWGWSTKKSKYLKGTFLLDMFASLTNIREWFKIPKGRKKASELANSHFHFTLTSTWSNFFKIGLSHYRLVQVNIELVNRRSSKHDWVRYLLRSFYHTDHIIPLFFSSIERIALKSPIRIQGVDS